MDKSKRTAPRARVESYKHAEATSPLRSDVVREHLARNVRTPFAPRWLNQIAVMVIDDRGIELLVVK
jgi:hypothetical protein